MFAAQLAALELALRGVEHWARRPRAVLFALASVALLRLAAARRERAVFFCSGALRGLHAVPALRSSDHSLLAFVVAVALAARHSWADVRPVLLRVLPWLALGSIALGAPEVWLVRRVAPLPRRGALAAAVVVAVGIAFGGRGCRRVAPSR